MRSRPPTPRSRCRPNTRTIARSSRLRSTSTKTLGHDPADADPADRAAVDAGGARGACGRARNRGAVMARPLVVAILGPTATGKSALGMMLARRFDGEVVSCDSTAVYRRFDIGTDKVPPAARQGVPHHLIDVADPTEEYSAAQYAREAAAAIRDITARGRLPILVGGTGLYYRALTRGFFPGPARDEPLRARLERIADRRGVDRLHALLGRVDPSSAARVHAAD